MEAPVEKHFKALGLDEANALACRGAGVKHDINLWDRTVHPRRPGFTHRSAAEVVNRIASNIGLPSIDTQDVHRLARKLATDAGKSLYDTSLWAAAEAYCELRWEGITWSRLPLSADALAGWLAKPDGSVIGLCLHWFDADDDHGSRGFLDADGTGPRRVHAVAVYGYDACHTRRSFPIFGKKTTTRVFLVEDPCAPSKRLILPAERIERHGVEALVLTDES